MKNKKFLFINIFIIPVILIFSTGNFFPKKKSLNQDCASASKSKKISNEKILNLQNVFNSNPSQIDYFNLLMQTFEKTGIVSPSVKQIVEYAIKILEIKPPQKYSFTTYGEGCFDSIQSVKLLPDKYKDRVFILAIDPPLEVPIDLGVVSMNYVYKNHKNKTDSNYFENEIAYFSKIK